MESAQRASREAGCPLPSAVSCKFLFVPSLFPRWGFPVLIHSSAGTGFSGRVGFVQPWDFRLTHPSTQTEGGLADWLRWGNRGPRGEQATPLSRMNAKGLGSSPCGLFLAGQGQNLSCRQPCQVPAQWRSSSPLRALLLCWKLSCDLGISRERVGGWFFLGDVLRAALPDSPVEAELARGSGCLHISASSGQQEAQC